MIPTQLFFNHFPALMAMIPEKLILKLKRIKFHLKEIACLTHSFTLLFFIEKCIGLDPYIP